MPSINQCEGGAGDVAALSSTLEIFDKFKSLPENGKDSDSEESFHLPLDDDDLESQSVVSSGREKELIMEETEEEILNKFETDTSDSIDNKNESILDDDEDEKLEKSSKPDDSEYQSHDKIEQVHPKVEIKVSWNDEGQYENSAWDDFKSFYEVEEVENQPQIPSESSLSSTNLAVETSSAETSVKITDEPVEDEIKTNVKPEDDISSTDDQREHKSDIGENITTLDDSDTPMEGIEPSVESKDQPEENEMNMKQEDAEENLPKDIEQKMETDVDYSANLNPTDLKDLSPSHIPEGDHIEIVQEIDSHEASSDNRDGENDKNIEEVYRDLELQLDSSIKEKDSDKIKQSSTDEKVFKVPEEVSKPSEETKNDPPDLQNEKSNDKSEEDDTDLLDISIIRDTDEDDACAIAAANEDVVEDTDKETLASERSDEDNEDKTKNEQEDSEMDKEQDENDNDTIGFVEEDTTNDSSIACSKESTQNKVIDICDSNDASLAATVEKSQDLPLLSASKDTEMSVEATKDHRNSAAIENMDDSANHMPDSKMDEASLETEEARDDGIETITDSDKKKTDDESETCKEFSNGFGDKDVCENQVEDATNKDDNSSVNGKMDCSNSIPSVNQGEAVSVKNSTIFHNVPTRNALRCQRYRKKKKLRQQGHREKIVEEELVNSERSSGNYEQGSVGLQVRLNPGTSEPPILSRRRQMSITPQKQQQQTGVGSPAGLAGRAKPSPVTSNNPVVRQVLPNSPQKPSVVATAQTTATSTPLLSQALQQQQQQQQQKQQQNKRPAPPLVKRAVAQPIRKAPDGQTKAVAIGSGGVGTAAGGTSSSVMIDLTDEDDRTASNKAATVNLVNKSGPLNGPKQAIRLANKTAISANKTINGTQKTVTVAPGKTQNLPQGIRLAQASVITSSAGGSQMVYLVPTTTSAAGGKQVFVNFQPTNGVIPATLNGPTVSMIQNKPGTPITVQTVPSTMRLRHPAPLPTPRKVADGLKPVLPKPLLTIKKIDTGIILQWKMPYNLDLYEEIASYQLYAYQETSAPPSTDMWRKVGDVKALALPMACTLTQFADKNKYYFAVRSVDVYKRIGAFSNPEEISL